MGRSRSCPCLTRSNVKECFNEARPPLGKRGGGTKWGTLKKNHSHAHTLSPPPPRTGGEEGREEEREREQQRKRKPTHTHTHSRTRACRSNRSSGMKKKPAGRDRARGVRIKRKLTDSMVSHFRSDKGPRHFNTPSLRPWISSRSLAGSHGVSGINKSNNTSQPGC